MPITASANTSGPNARAASGKSGRQKRRNPYVPIFRRTPARITLPAVGASTWASGSQVWNGNSGTLIAKASAKPRNMRLCARPGAITYWVSRGRSNVYRPVAVLIVEGEDRHQHEHRADHRVEHELHRGVDPVGAAPDPDDEVHRDQHRLPEHVEQEEVEADEDPEHPGLEDQHRRHELLDAVLDGVPGRRERQRHEERRQEHEQEADAVDPHVVAHPERRHPPRVLLELIAD